MVCLILNNEIINNNKAAVIIEGPEGVLNFKDENKPKITDNKPPIIENRTICLGVSERFLAKAAGIINIPVTNNKPINEAAITEIIDLDVDTELLGLNVFGSAEPVLIST